MKTVLFIAMSVIALSLSAATAVAYAPDTAQAQKADRIRAHKAKLAERRAMLAKMTPEQKKEYLEKRRAEMKEKHAIKMANMTPEEKAAIEAQKKAAKESLDARLFVASVIKRGIEGMSFADGKYVIMFKDGKTVTVDSKDL